MIRSPGISSGLDVNAIVTQLVAAERLPAAQRIQRQDTRLTTQISALGTLRGALGALQAAVSPLKTVASFQTRAVASSNEGIFTATATSSAAPGSFEIEVVAVASAQKIASNAFAGGAPSVVGTGTLSIAAGVRSFDVVIDDTNNTLAGIRDAINLAPNNTAVRASIVTTTDGSRLILSARESGAVNGLQVTASGGDGGLTALDYNAAGPTGNYTQLAAAADALVRVEGFDVSSSTNTISGAIDGVTLNLENAAPGSLETVTVINDNESSVERIKKFVADFNATAGTLANLRRFNPTTRDAGPLLGDAMLRNVENDLRRQIATATTGATPPYTTLASIGITTSKDGSLQLDETKLNAAMAADFDGVGRLFGTDDGIAARIDASLERVLAGEAQLDNRTSNLQAQKRALDTDRANLDRRMVAVEARYRAQFSALDVALAGLQSTASYLAQQLARTTSN
ncbi:MAG: flagellar filament capping protein FliD [Steroidobacteraceae bacterium]